VSVGKLGYDDLMAHGQFSLDEISFRSYLVYSHLMQTGSRVHKSTLYESLDSTEKGAASYFIGMAASKLVGMFLLRTPWLVHLQKLNAFLKIGLQGKSRPDLLGLNSQGEWVVFEAKGRTYGFSQHAVDRAKAQTKQIRQVSGQMPALRVATESYFSPSLSIWVVEPEGLDEDAIDLNLDQTQFYYTYYSTLTRVSPFSSRHELFNNHRYKFIDHERAGVSIGINQNILDRLGHGEFTQASIRDVPSDTNQLIRQDGRSTRYYPDGIAVALDEKRWGTEIMSVEPSNRRYGGALAPE
jgi:hypothetical protein